MLWVGKKDREEGCSQSSEMQAGGLEATASTWVWLPDQRGWGGAWRWGWRRSSVGLGAGSGGYGAGARGEGSGEAGWGLQTPYPKDGGKLW